MQEKFSRKTKSPAEKKENSTQQRRILGSTNAALERRVIVKLISQPVGTPCETTVKLCPTFGHQGYISRVHTHGFGKHL